MFGYNDMNTNVPNPFVTQGNIVLSGAGRKFDPSKFKKIDTDFNWIENERRATMPKKKNTTI